MAFGKDIPMTSWHLTERHMPRQRITKRSEIGETAG